MIIISNNFLTQLTFFWKSLNWIAFSIFYRDYNLIDSPDISEGWFNQTFSISVSVFYCVAKSSHFWTFFCKSNSFEVKIIFNFRIHYAVSYLDMIWWNVYWLIIVYFCFLLIVEKSKFSSFVNTLKHTWRKRPVIW